MILAVLALLPLYAADISFQAYDTYSTLRLQQHGAIELNPLTRAIAHHPLIFIGVKAGLTAVPIVSAERMWHAQHHRRAVLMLIATDGLLAGVAAHNAAVWHRGPPKRTRGTGRSAMPNACSR